MHLRKLPSGAWQASLWHNGQRRSVTGRTRGEAQQAAAEALLEMGATPKASGVTVGDLCAVWKADAAGRLSHTYWVDARRVLDRLPAAFAARKIDEVTPAVIEGLYRQLAREKWSPHRIERLHGVLSSAWSLARRYEWTTSAPFQVIRKPAAPKARIAPPDPGQVAALLAAADGLFALYLTLSAAIGTRRGETVALQWADIAGTTIVVRRSLAYTPLHGVVATEGKTGRAGHRPVAIDSELARLLQAHRRHQVEQALAAGLPAPVWIFSHDAGVTPWRPDYVSREFRHLRTALGLPATIRLHDLRHFVATQLLANGVALKTVSERLGHRQMATTADIYAHYVPAADLAAAEVMAGLRRTS